MRTAARGATDLRRAALLMCLSALSFAFMGAAVKMAAAEVNPAMTVFFRSAVMLMLAVPWTFAHGRRALVTHNLRGHLFRGISGLGSMSCYFYALSHMRLADAVLLYSSFPLFMPAVEMLWMREPLPRGTWPSLVLGFVGVVLILKPGAGVFTFVALAGLTSAVFSAISQVGVRRLTQTESVTNIVFYFAVIATVGSALALVVGWQTPTSGTLAALIATGVFATIGQYGLTHAYSYAPAPVVGPFIYTGVIFAALLDLLLWHVLPDVLFIPGGLLIGAAGGWMLRHRSQGADDASSGLG